MMRSAKFAAFVFLYALGTGTAFAHDEADDRPHGSTRDKIRIIALQPSGPVKPGVETTFNSFSAYCWSAASRSSWA